MAQDISMSIIVDVLSHINLLDSSILWKRLFCAASRKTLKFSLS